MTIESTIPTRQKFLRRIVLICTLLLLCFACVLPEIMLAAIQIAGHCLAGAIRFSARAVEKIQADRTGATISLIAFVILVYGTQFALGRFRTPSNWTKDHAIRAVFGGICLVASGFCVASLTNTLLWDATTSVPWFRISLTRDANYRTIASNNLKQVGTALHAYHDHYQSFPPGGVFRSSGIAGHGWMAQLLPYIDQKDVYDRIRFELPWYHRFNREAYETRIPYFEDPIIQSTTLPGREYGPAHYAANDQVMNANRGFSIPEMTDGISNTILAGSIKDRPRAWGDAANWRRLNFGINKSIDGFGSNEPGGAFFLMADGSVRFINDDTDVRMLRALGSPDSDDMIWEY